MVLTLIVLNGPGKGQVFHLTGDEPAVIGRQAPQLRLADPEASRRHAEIRCENNTWIIRDLGSTNGTFVNGRQLTGLTELEEGDQILIGRVMLVVGKLATADDTAVLPPSVADDSAFEPVDAAEHAPSAVSPRPREDVAADLIRLEDDDPLEPTSSVHDAPAAPVAPHESDESVSGASRLWGQTSSAAAEEPAAEQGYLAAHADLMDLAGLTDDEADDDHDVDESVPAAHESADLDHDLDLDLDAAADDVPAQPTEQEPPAATPAEDVPPTAEARSAPPAAPSNAPTVDSTATDDHGTGLLHHVGLPGEVDRDSSSAADNKPAPQVPPLAGLVDAADEVEDAADQRAPFGSSPPATHAADAGDENEVPWALLDEDEDRSENEDAAAAVRPVLNDTGDEQGVNLADLGPAPENGEERPTSIIAEAVQIHAPYQQRQPQTIDAGPTGAPKLAAPGVPKNPDTLNVPAEDNDAPQRISADEPRDDGPASERPRKPRRAVAAVLLSMLLLGVGAGGLIYAIQQGYASWPPQWPQQLRWPQAGTALRMSDEPVPEPWTSSAPPAAALNEATETTARPQARPTAALAAQAFVEDAIPRRGREESAISPPADALSDAPRLTGETILAHRVARPSRPLGTASGAPDGPANVDAPNTPDVPATTNTSNPTTVPDSSDQQDADDVGHNFAVPRPDDAAATSLAMPVPTPPSSPQDTARAPAASDASGSGAATGQVTPSPESPRPPTAAARSTHRVVFLVDASGSLLDTLDDVVAWLGTRLDRLNGAHEFTVLFFRQGEPIEVPPVGLRPATADTISHVKQWMDPKWGHVAPSGRSDPLPALERALAYDVDEIVLMSDDSFSASTRSDGTAERLDRIDKMLENDDVVVHTVQFFYEDPRHVLRRLAERHGGTYRFVSPETPVGPDPLGLLQNLSAVPGNPPSDAPRAQ